MKFRTITYVNQSVFKKVFYILVDSPASLAVQLRLHLLYVHFFHLFHAHPLLLLWIYQLVFLFL
jgi:hypothetical protein